jgi:dephospho-CoA kinase
MVMIIGITGSIASGKSTACKSLVSLGAKHCDADKLVHKMYAPGKPAYYRILETFGNDLIDNEGNIDRKNLGSKVFGKPQEMAKLTKAIGNIAQEIEGVMKNWRETLGANDVALMEAVNFIEAGYGRYSDVTWLFVANDEIAISRLQARNSLTYEQALQRLSSQKNWTERESASDLITHNDNTIEDLIMNVKQNMGDLTKQHREGKLPVSNYMKWWEKTQN